MNAKYGDLKKMFMMQFELQKSKGIWDKVRDNPEMLQKYLNQNFLALHEEAVEIMRETAYKNPKFVEFGWKKHQEMNVDNAKDELIDLWHFVMNISLALGMDADEFYLRYYKKNKINFERDENGY